MAAQSLLSIPATRLRHRGVLQLAGRDTYDFLHAMSTCNAKAMPHDRLAYCAFLNGKGRMLFDAVLHPVADAAEPTVLVEMDRASVAGAIEHLKEYKLRKKVKFEDRSDDLAVIVSGGPEQQQQQQEAMMMMQPDPRPPVAEELGLRRGLLGSSALASADVTDNALAYRDRLFALGVGDGADVFTAGKSLPFDGNLDALEGVSFHKGCYVGQELTHRTHVMLIVRKRLVPFEVVGDGGAGLSAEVAASLVGKSIASTTNDVSCGRITAWGSTHGVGLFRLANFNNADASVFTVGGVQIRPRIPSWWPADFMEKIATDTPAAAAE